MHQNFKKNICNGEQWLHVAWIILFVVIYSVIKIVLFATVFFQIVHTLIFSNQQQRLRCFAAQLALYIYELIQFITYNQKEKPFPFAPWPEVDSQPFEPELEEAIDVSDTPCKPSSEDVIVEPVVVEAEIVEKDVQKKGE